MILPSWLSQKSEASSKEIIFEGEENFSEMATTGEQQQDEDAAELTFPKVTY